MGGGRVGRRERSGRGRELHFNGPSAYVKVFGGFQRGKNPGRSPGPGLTKEPPFRADTGHRGSARAPHPAEYPDTPIFHSYHLERVPRPFPRPNSSKRIFLQ